MMGLSDGYTLANGVKIPCVGLGTWKGDWNQPDNDVVSHAVQAAIEAGFRHIDTAASYRTEEGVGRGIRESGIPRSEVFVTTKLWNDVRGYQPTIDAFNKSMKNLGLDYLDLYLIHWPNPVAFRDHWQENNAETWRAFEDLYKAGDIRAIGVSNFRPHHLAELARTATVSPMVNQLPVSPGCILSETIKYSRAHNMAIEGYSPFGTGSALKLPEVEGLSKKYGMTAAQICLRWSIQMGVIPLPKSITPSRILENTGVFDFELSAEDVDILTNLRDGADTPVEPDTSNF